MSSARGIALGLGIATTIAACVKGATPTPEWQRRQQKMNEITALWTQIRDWRREAHMELDPSPATLFQWRDRTVREAARVCPDGHEVPSSCDEVCNLSDAICDNAEAICGIATELGPKDELAQEKCQSAKASCREAKQRCCGCSEEPAPEPGPEAAPAGAPMPGTRTP